MADMTLRRHTIHHIVYPKQFSKMLSEGAVLFLWICIFKKHFLNLLVEKLSKNYEDKSEIEGAANNFFSIVNLSVQNVITSKADSSRILEKILSYF